MILFSLALIATVFALFSGRNFSLICLEYNRRSMEVTCPTIHRLLPGQQVQREFYLLVTIVDYLVDLAKHLLEFIALGCDICSVGLLESLGIPAVLLVHFEHSLKVCYLVRQVLISS